MADKKLERLRKLIDRSKKTRQELATALGCDTSMVTKHYNGDRAVSVDFLVKYAQYFNVTTDYLLGLSDEHTTDTNLNAVCKYTGLSAKAIQKIQSRKKDLFFKECLEFLIKDEDFFDKISSYLFSSMYEYFTDSEYFQDIQTKDDIYWIVQNYLLIQKSRFSLLMEEFPKKKEEIRDHIIATNTVDRWMYHIACRSVDEGKLFFDAGYNETSHYSTKPKGHVKDPYYTQAIMSFLFTHMQNLEKKFLEEDRPKKTNTED